MIMLVNAPAIGQWYSDIQHRYFEVVAVNNDDIDIQFIDGTVDELEAEAWLQISPVAVMEPSIDRCLFEEMDYAEYFDDWQESEPLQKGWQGFLDKW